MNYKNTYFIIDGTYLMFRTFYGIKDLKRRSDNFPTNAVWGLTKTLLNLIDDYKGANFIVASDSPVKTFRHNIFKDYKANRSEKDPNLKMQLEKLPIVCEGLCIPCLKKDTFEADDLIVSMAQHIVDNNDKSIVYIVSADKDLMQVVGDRISIYDPFKKITINSCGVKDKMGVDPKQMTTYQSLVGDASDNIPGVRSIGAKGAVDLISRFGTLENIYDNLTKIKPSTRLALEEHRANAFLSRELATLINDVNLEYQSVLQDKYRLDEKTAIEFIRKELEAPFLIKLVKEYCYSSREILHNENNLETISVDSWKKQQKDATRVIVIVDKEQNLCRVAWQYKDKTIVGIKVDNADILEVLAVVVSSGLKVITDNIKDIWRILLDNDAVDVNNISRFYDISLLSDLTIGPLEDNSRDGLASFFSLITKDDYLKLTGVYDNLISLLDKNRTDLYHKIDLPLSFLSTNKKLDSIKSDNRKSVIVNYPQIELRLIADIADVSHLKEIFKNDKDLHKEIEHSVFKLKNKSDGELQEEDTILEDYYEVSPEVKLFIEKSYEKVSHFGFAETPWGRRRFFNDKNNSIQKDFVRKNSSDFILQKHKEDILNYKIVEIFKNIKIQNLDAKLSAEICNRLTIECSENDVDKVVSIIVEVSQDNPDLSVPLKVETEVDNY
ncbi:MAG: hypothetical protein JJV96_00805 [Alphaproteobacteria bacterium]|nr:hypothetical protein [Alphaproteobacteria bacterium]